MSTHRGFYLSPWYTQYTIFNIKMTITLNYLKSEAIGFFQGAQERFQNSHGKRDICSSH